MSTLCGGWIYIACFSLVSGFAQQNGPAGQSELPASVRPVGGDRQMTLDVVVTDKSGKPVSGLQQQDFTLLDNKQPQKILFFQAVEGGAATAHPPLEVILVLDEVNTSFTGMATARNGIEKFLQRNGGALGQPVSVIYISDSGATETTSSRDGIAVISELNEKQASLRTHKRSQGVYGGFERIELSLKALLLFADHQESRPGRKLVVWVSPGWPLLNQPGVVMNLSARQRQHVFDSIVAVSEALRRAHITLYAIDPLGLADARQYPTMAYMQFSKGVKSVRQAEYGHLALQVLAYQSGGRVFNSGNDLASEIAKCVADANAFYVLSFHGVAGDGLDEYHALEIKIDKPGLAARTRSGYYAQPESDQP